MASASNANFGMPFSVATHAQSASVGNTGMPTQNDGVAHVMRFGCSGTSDTITHVGYRQGVTTGTPASNSYTIGIQSLDASGLPSGTWLGTSNTTFTPIAANDSSWVWVALGSTYAPARDEAIALVIQRTAATDAGNTVSAASANAWLTQRPGLPYAVTAAAGTWTKNNSSGATMGCKSASIAYGYPAKNVALTGNTYGTTTERGMSFTVPTNFCSTYKVKGVRWVGIISSSASANTHTANLYSGIGGSNPVIEQSSNATDVDINAATSSIRTYEMFFTGTLVTLNAGTKYCIGLSTTGAGTGTIYVAEAGTASDFEAWDFGTLTAAVNRTLASAYPPDSSDGPFTETTTQRPYMELILDDLTPPSGGGGLAANPLRGFL